MKIRIPYAAEVMLLFAFIGVLGLGGLILFRTLSQPVSFESIEVKNSPRAGDLLIVEATVKREPIDGCTNGVQIDVRDQNGVEARYPIPTRQVAGVFTRYAIVVPEVANVGDHQLRVRETVYCGWWPKTAETPWITFTVAP